MKRLKLDPLYACWTVKRKQSFVHILIASLFGQGLGPHITVINHDETTKGSLGNAAYLSVSEQNKGGPGGAGRNMITGAPSPSQLSRQGSSVESHTSSVPIHFHTAECSATGRSLHQPTHHSKVEEFRPKMIRLLMYFCFTAAWFADLQ